MYETEGICQDFACLICLLFAFWKDLNVNSNCSLLISCDLNKIMQQNNDSKHR